jgi:hypothetical protein
MSKQKPLKSLLSQTLALLILSTALANLSGFSAPKAVNPWGGQEITPNASGDPTKPVSRGYIVPSATEIPGGSKISVEIFQDRLNAPVSLFLQAAIKDSNGKSQLVTVKSLDSKVNDNPTLYYSKRDFDINYQDLNSEIQKFAPGATSLVVGPGTPLFVYAQFENGSQFFHQWGGVARGGIVFMPGQTLQASSQGTPDSSTRPSELDIAYPINQTLANQFVDRNSKAGLQVGGQIRSRVEAEGKFQIPLNDFDHVRAEIFKLAKDPALAQTIFGADWTFELQERYLLKNADGSLQIGADGFPVPDAMVDTYYDNDKFEAAKNDIAIRYRFTKGNNTGAWNFKPGLALSTPDGIVNRVEYGVDTTDDKPDTIRKFADSTHPVNPFQMIRTVVPGSNPSDFLNPAIKLTDDRYKIVLKHKNGLAIEVSVDKVTAESLKGDGKKPVQYVQVEADIEHLATNSANIAQSNLGGLGLGHVDPSTISGFLGALDSKAEFDGKVVLHNLDDLKMSSPLQQARAQEFALATQAIVAFRDKIIGNNWLPGAQKYAYAAQALGLVSAADASTSVKTMLAKQKQIEANVGPAAGQVSASKCQLLFK